MALERDPAGRNAKLYYSTTLLTANDTSTIETWLASATIAGDIYDESDNLEPEYADITTRAKAAGGFSARKPIIRDGEITFDFSWETQAVSANFVQDLIDAANNFTRIAVVALDYAYDDANLATGEFAQGPAGNWYVSFTKTSPIRDAQRGSATLTASDLVTWFKHSAAP